MNLHDEPQLFRQLILLSAEKFTVDEGQVEKDYWITKVLKDIADSEFCGRVFFKGGTSLSKAYGMISRFSEDLDLYVDTGDPMPEGIQRGSSTAKCTSTSFRRTKIGT